ncbi:hypothetical protein [Brassicibacter mesophilus]|uniref:hypothetical protein n=1 Tax=Brassicibacter mesophilus TaxID=745119 RepID=UPI003D1A2592
MNERLTKRTKKGIAYMAVADKLSKADQEIEGSKPILEGLYAIFQKLADYEDTKLSPEEIKALIADNKHLRNYLVKLEHERFNSLINKYVELSEQNRELAEKLKVNTEDFADYLIENASVAFEHQDRELLESTIKRYFEEVE